MTVSMKRTTPPQGPGGLALALGLVVILLAGSGLIAWGLARLTVAEFPTAPPYLLLIYLAVVLVPAMFFLLRGFPWLMNWYYLVPSLVFLLAFTVFPVVLTVNFAFTNYSGVNSGYPDTSFQTPVKLSPDRRTITFSAIPNGVQSLTELYRCPPPKSCAGQNMALYDQAAVTPVTAAIQSISGLNVTLAAPLAAGFTPVNATRINAINYLGLQNFQQIFASAGVQLLPVFGWTVSFAVITVFLNALAGLILGILLYNKRLKGRNVYRTLLFLPWAIPTVISVQMWAALYNQQFGIVNKFLGLMGANPIPWLSDALWAKIAIILVNLWLGFPYMMTATISALSTISDDLYEAASIDGATRWQQILYITLPLLRNSFTPILLSGFAFNFNNFGIIYLLTAGGPPVAGRPSTTGGTDILISWGYNTAFVSSGGQNYSAASAIAVIVFFLTIAISLVSFRAAGVFNEARR